MDREFDDTSSGTSLCGAICRNICAPVFIIIVWALTLCSPAVANASTPAVSVSATSLHFGYTSVGTKAGPENLFVTNSGTARLTISSITLTGANPVDFTQTNNCGASLAAGANCLVQVLFKPTAPGTRTTVLNIKDNASGSPQKVTFSGAATANAPAVSLSATSLSFGNYAVGAVVGPQNLFVTNSGNAPLAFTSIKLTGNNASDFTQTNNCSGSFAAGANCLVQVMFKPSAAGARTIVLSIADNATGSPQSVTFSGTATASAPAVSLSATSLYFGYYAVGTTGGPENLFVTNSGTSTLTLTSIVLTGANASDFTQTNNCGGSLAAGANCLVQVMFKPSAAGTRTTTLSIADNATGSPQSVTFSATATASTATVNLSPASLTFASQAVGATSAAQTLTITNSGNVALTISSLTITGANAGDFTQTSNCGLSVAAGANCAIGVTFKPAAAGARSAAISVSDNATGSPQAAALSGTGTSSVATVSPSSLTFASQAVGATGAPQTITIINSGNAALSVTSIVVAGANASDFTQTNNCGSSVAAGANCTLSVIFAPSASGSRAASLSVTDNASGSPQTVSLCGTGTAAVASVSPSSLTFGSQSIGVTSAAQAITVNNTGNAALGVTNVAVSGVNASDFAQTNSCGSSVAAGANCTISVTFKSTAPGTRVAAITISDCATGSPQTVSLSGAGTTSTVYVSPSNLSFGSQSVDTTSSAQMITLTNSGNVALTISSLAISGANAGDFTLTNNCGSNVAAGANCTIGVTFAPSASGSRAASLSIADSASGSPQIVSVGGNGTSTTDDISLSSGSLAFSNQAVEMTSTAQTATLTNTGTTALTIASFAVTGANSSDFVQNNNCGSSVAAGGKCTIVVLFTPSAIGARAATLSISDSSNGSPQTVSLSGAGSHDVILSWTASPTANVIGYNLYRGTASGGESATPLNTTPINGTNFTDETVTAGATYYYPATSVSSCGVTQSAASPEISTTVPST